MTMNDLRRIYLDHRIGDQLHYYQRQEGRAQPLFRRLKLGFWIATILALLCTLAYAVAHTMHAEVPHWVEPTVFYFLPIALPVVAASFISLISINDLQRRAARYREMRALLQEVLEWHSITSFSESN
jgi:hypothetical protein